MCKLNFKIMRGEVPDFFHDSKGLIVLEAIANLVKGQAETELSRWYKIIAICHSHAGRPLPEFDFRGLTSSESYLAMFQDGDITDVRVALGKPDFDNFEWSDHIKNNAASLIIAFFSRNKCAGMRVVLTSTDGQIMEIHDFGMGEAWRNDVLLERSIKAILAKYASFK